MLMMEEEGIGGGGRVGGFETVDEAGETGESGVILGEMLCLFFL